MTDPTITTDETVATIGDIVVSRHWVVTPEGTAPIAGARFDIVDHTYKKAKHPAWTIVLAIVLFPIGLLFLLVKKEALYGVLEVTVAAEGLHYAAQIPPRDPMRVVRIRDDVNRARSLAAK